MLMRIFSELSTSIHPALALFQFGEPQPDSHAIDFSLVIGL